MVEIIDILTKEIDAAEKSNRESKALFEKMSKCISISDRINY
jgi:hypothetical protein